MGCHHEDPVSTPYMDAFARESMDFSNAYSTFPLCSPHRASLMTGKYPYQAGMWTNCKIGLEEKIMLKPQETCIGNVLKEHGYATGYIGKWHLDASEMNFLPNPPSGARDWDAYTPKGERRQGFDYWLSYGACDDHLNPHYWMDSETQICPGKWSAEYETDKAIEFIEERRGQNRPFALFLSYNPPHLPYELVPERYKETTRDLELSYRPNVPPEMRGGALEAKTKLYFAAVHGINEQFGRILSYLRSRNLEENTLVALSADHGDMMGSQGRMGKNVWYRESIHIPFLIRQKGRIRPGVNSALFASPDHMPTLLGLLGLPVPETCEGYNHAESVLEGTGRGPEDMFLCSYPGTKEMVAAFEKRGLTQKAYGWRGIKTKTHTYVICNGYWPGEEQREWLYDDEKDPYQLSPEELPAGCRREDILGYRARLREYLEKINDPFLWKERGAWIKNKLS